MLKTIIFALIALLLAAIAVLVIVQPTKSLTTAIDIDAPPERVWQVLTDFAAYPQWNPFVRRLAGEPRAGARLEADIGNPGSEPMTFTPIVLVADAPHEFRWRGSLSVPRLFIGEHYFLLKPRSDGGTHLVHGELFKGALIPVMGEGFWNDTRRGLEAMNIAMKARAEALPGPQVQSSR